MIPYIVIVLVTFGFVIAIAVAKLNEYRYLRSKTGVIFCQRWAVAWYEDRHFAEHRMPRGFAHITVTAEELQVVPKIKYLYGFYRLASFYCPAILAYDLRYLSASMKRPGVVHVVYSVPNEQAVEFELHVRDGGALMSALSHK